MGLKHNQSYVCGRKFIMRKDHMRLIYLFIIRDPSSRLIKFRFALKWYDYIIEYVKGADNARADELSRMHITSTELTEMNEMVFNIRTKN